MTARVVGRAGSRWSAASRSPSASSAIAGGVGRRAIAGPTVVDLPIRYSHFARPMVTVQAGVPVTIVLRNDDPIDHEWIVGDEARPRAPSERHRARRTRRARPR